MRMEDSARARWITLVIVCMAALMSVVDGTIVNVALPAIQRSLHYTSAELTWVVNAYLISYGSFLLLAGRLGDLIGRRRVFLAGVALFTVASALCGFARSQSLLIVARFLQGLGGAGATAAIVAIIASEFPEPSARAKAMSVYMFVLSGGASLGLILGGVITQAIDWHWIFFINVPIGVATFLFARVLIRENETLGIGADVDVLGSVLVTAAVMLGAYAIVTSSSDGWHSAHTLSFAAAAVVLLAAFIALEARLRNPIMPLRIFRLPGLAASCGVRGLLMSGMYASFFIGVLYMQHVLRFGVLETGIAFLPQTIAMGVLSAGPCARIVSRYGTGPPLLVGLVLSAIALVLLTQVGADTSYWTHVFPAFLLIGLGGGLAFMPLLVIAMARVPPADAGLASGIINTSLQLSAALSVAVLGSVAAARSKSLARSGESLISSLVGGYHLAFVVGSVGVGLAIIATVVLLRPAQIPGRAGAPAPVSQEVEAEAEAALLTDVG